MDEGGELELQATATNVAGSNVQKDRDMGKTCLFST
jgi:hypothetical protein